VVLSADPSATPPEHIGEIEVLMTVVGGKVVYRRGGFATPAPPTIGGPRPPQPPTIGPPRTPTPPTIGPVRPAPPSKKRR
jgi:hypothetical protein